MKRQGVADGTVEPSGERQREIVARAREVGAGSDLRVERRLRLSPQVVGPILVRFAEDAALDAQSGGQPLAEARGVPGVEAVLAALVGEPAIILPQRLPVAAPVAAEGPARERLAGVPLALAVLKEAARRERRLEAREQDAGALSLVRSEGRRVPLGPLHVVDRDERGLTTHREAHVQRLDLAVDGAPERADLGPLLLGVRLGHARVFEHARDLVAVDERHLALVGEAGQRRGAHRIGRARERDVTLAGEQARGGVEPDPARARHVHFGPGVQIGEVLLRTGGAVE